MTGPYSFEWNFLNSILNLFQNDQYFQSVCQYKVKI